VTRHDPAWAAKVESRGQFERAVAYYQTRHVHEARILFAQLCARSCDDGPAHIYLARCEEFLRDGTHHSTGEISTRVEWSHDYDVGIVEIDEQHQEWCRRLGELLQLLRSGRQEGVAGLFDYLRDYIHWHFSQEEELMDEHAYPLRDEHKLEHSRYAQALERFRTELTDGWREPLLVTFRANLFLIDWFVNHTTGSDRELGRYLAAARRHPGRVVALQP
jgi:hemerythrin-like metal-binding protein